MQRIFDSPDIRDRKRERERDRLIFGRFTAVFFKYSIENKLVFVFSKGVNILPFLLLVFWFENMALKL